jgi:hypothetical protein
MAAIDMNAVIASYSGTTNITTWNQFIGEITTNVATALKSSTPSGSSASSAGNEEDDINKYEKFTWQGSQGVEDYSVLGFEEGVLGVGIHAAVLDGGYSIVGQIATMNQLEEAAIKAGNFGTRFVATLGLSLIS